ncbi:hypothetical protein COEREDRAFT_98810 [Coemansia reversa NRRL 1564]|uniref:PAS domain-containing protein n=1 Tax=Coemansia reversa (strain ATCC 12441 / NRRL 1564) TaxID=763665 RepID=A0A2G5B686_COERN|nr:hypothetical protein COEREDRAFT_98810 [Coemansia reversa NRRL 1564]|eukprot:PIA14536.1 hypothetical protein COEREDRAFT_98810 [Coemansia reversa NRRL 1564]
MANAQSQDSSSSLSFIGVHDESSEMRILYVSSNVEQVLNIHPKYIIGQSSHAFFASGKSQEYHMQTKEMEDENVSIVYTSAVRNDLLPVHLRLVHFKCDGIRFNACYASSENHFQQQSRVGGVSSTSVKGVSEIERQTTAKTANIKCPMSVNLRAVYELETTRNRLLRSRRNTLGMVRACMVLGALEDIDNIDMLGPLVKFASSSFERIIGTDTCDIQGKPFLSLVATQDTLKAGKFLKRMTETRNITSETLLLQVNPFEDLYSHGNIYGNNNSTDVSIVKEKVRVEIIGAGGDDGAILLVQFQRLPLYSGCHAAEDESMEANLISLEDIISSDPETSDYARTWRLVRENDL